jgi:hypothetical protein
VKTRVSLALLGLTLSVAGIVIFSMQAYGQESYSIPQWIKNNAKWWADGQIGDSDFVKGIQYLIDNNILHASSSNQNSNLQNTIVGTIKGEPTVKTDKQTYKVGEEIKISGSGFESGAANISVSDDTYQNHLWTSLSEVHWTTNLPELSILSGYDFLLNTEDINCKYCDLWIGDENGIEGYKIITGAKVDGFGTWEKSLNTVSQPISLGKGDYTIQVGQRVYSEDVSRKSLEHGSRTLFLKTAFTVFKVE